MISTRATSTAHEGTGKPYDCRDQLLKIQRDVQRRWEEGEVFNADAGPEPPAEGEKYFGNFPYPYMNGSLHLGHAFSLSKLEFASAYHRLRGRNVLFPFAFHCTGMPIKACADKLDNEITQFGDPPVFPTDNNDEVVEDQPPSEQQFKSKRSKASAKKGSAKYQWQIMQSLGLQDREIAQFRDPHHWLTYFPPMAMEDLKMFGVGVDWRRSFITTDMNPFYDSFVRWQMRVLKDMGKIVKDMRYTIYSPLDGQPCADHDRAFGEGVQPQEYTLIKMEVIPPFTGRLKILEGRNVFLAAATLRAETMYDQTNAWVLPDGKYGAFEINDRDVFIITQKAALNLAYQHMSKVPKRPSCLVELTRHDLIGLPLKAPLAANDDVYALPMLTILTDKGIGIVTSMPSDSPDDYMALFNDTEGKMLMGKFKGMEVQVPKSSIGKKLLERGKAVMYSEPERKVISRSGDECVVALTDQWYVTYGEPEWRAKARQCLAKMGLYHDEARHGFEHTLGWLNQWACSRSFGLGTRIPWDEQFLVESLSDSTLYMAYYTVAHLLQNGDIYGKTATTIKAEQMTDQVWNYIFCGGPFPHEDIPADLLKRMKREFEYWYPFDLRVSGKDLIQNHLSFCIYNHTAILPEEKWPRSFRCNGHLMLNSKKMSKSTGNFRTLRQAIEDFSSDATRYSLADAGDRMDDANFAFKTANTAILRLTKEIKWMQRILASAESLRQGSPSTYADRVFSNEINIAIELTEKNYNTMMFREALKTGFYDLQAARDEYRLSCGLGGMNRDLLWRFMDVQTRLITPICPHYAEHVWKEILKREGFAVKSGWPTAEPPDLTLQRANKYLQDTIVSMRKQMSAPKKDTLKPSIGLLYVEEEYKDWKAVCLRILQDEYDRNSHSFGPDQETLAAIGRHSDLKQLLKQCMSFVRSKKNETLDVGPQALGLKLPFGEIQVLEENVELIKRQIGLDELEVLYAADENAKRRAGPYVSVLKQTPPRPGKPTAVFMTASNSKQNSETNLAHCLE